LFENVADERVRRALLLMEQNLARPVAIGYVAKQLGLSVRQFERLCRSALGTGPASLYRRIRMRYAQWLISNTDRSMTTIALEAGFADGAHFSRQYKETYGLSPSLRRKQGGRRRSGLHASIRLTRLSVAPRTSWARHTRAHRLPATALCPGSGLKLFPRS
jgi:transcriptional regulator GlxA family with amidase domain